MNRHPGSRGSFRWLLAPLLVAVLGLAGCGSRSVPGVGGDAGDGVPSELGAVFDQSVTDRGPISRERGNRDQRPVLDRTRPPDTRRDGKPKPPTDGPAPDQGVCQAMGLPCTSDKDCCTPLGCATLFTGAKVCTQTCTPDISATPLVNEDTCPGAPTTFICANVAAPSTVTYRCLKRCTPTQGANTCSPGLSCAPASTVMTQSAEKAVCGFPACKTGKDCPVYLAPLCGPGSPVPQCVGLPTGAFCAPHYPGSFSGRCALPGVCDTKSGLCAAHTLGKTSAKVGDPCIDDRDCGGAMECQMEVSTSGVTYFRNGYCSIEGCIFAATFSQKSCPSGSVCSSNYYGGRCFRTCDLKVASTCRGQTKDKHGDYDCRAWNNVGSAIKGGKVTSVPICEPGYASYCTLFSATGLKGLNCSILGLTGNPTQMACRAPGTGKILADDDPLGFCLDTTPSGP